MTKSRTIVESIEVHGRREVDVPEDVLEDLLSVITEDAWDELDELSKATLASYIGKAGYDSFGQGVNVGMSNLRSTERKEGIRKGVKRSKGIIRAAQRLAKSS